MSQRALFRSEGKLDSIRHDQVIGGIGMRWLGVVTWAAAVCFTVAGCTGTDASPTGASGHSVEAAVPTPKNYVTLDSPTVSAAPVQVAASTPPAAPQPPPLPPAAPQPPPSRSGPTIAQFASLMASHEKVWRQFYADGPMCQAMRLSSQMSDGPHSLATCVAETAALSTASYEVGTSFDALGDRPPEISMLVDKTESLLGPMYRPNISADCPPRGLLSEPCLWDQLLAYSLMDKFRAVLFAWEPYGG